MRYQARAPLRIYLGGDGTDFPEFARTGGGAVLTMAITRYVRGRINRPDWTGTLRFLRSDRSYLSYSCDVPLGAGLGVSAAQTVLWVTLMRMGIENDRDRRRIAEMSCSVAETLGILDGTGEEYASALGGITFRTFGESVEHESIGLDSATAEALRGRLVLVLGEESGTRLSPRARIASRYRAGDRGVTEALAELKRLAADMKGALLIRDLDALAELIHGTWMAQRIIDPDPRIESLVELGHRHGAKAAKASGPGDRAVLFMTGSGGPDALIHGLAHHRLHRIDFDFDSLGIFVTKE